MRDEIMNLIRYYVRGQWVDEHLVQWITTILILINFGLGIAVFVGGVERFQFPTYQPLVDLTNGNIWIWGIWIVIAATLMTAPIRWVNALGLFLGMAWMYTWMGLFVISVKTYEQSAAAPMVVYGGLAMLHLAILVARILERDVERE